MIALLALTLLSPAAARAQTAIAPSAGDGLTTDTAYQITELGNLVWLGEQTATSVTATSNATTGKYYKLMNDIDASVTATWNDEGTTTDTLEGFKPIGSVFYDPSRTFCGIFFGGGHTISELVINRSSLVNSYPFRMHYGLFSAVGSSGQVIDLRLANSDISGQIHVGSLTGCNFGTITACHASGVTIRGEDTGGLIGINLGGTVSRCSAEGDVAGTGNVGGLIGYCGDEGIFVSDCWATGKVVGYGSVGGLIGNISKSTVRRCQANASVSGTSGVGGLIGCNDSGQIISCYSDGTISGDHFLGGISGLNYPYSMVRHCYSMASVSGHYALGGLVGYNKESKILLCYASGKVVGENSVGGLIGVFERDYGYEEVSKSYWDMMTTGQSFSAGGAGAIGRSTYEMRQQATFDGWDFEKVWGIRGAYPYLRNLTTCTLTYSVAAPAEGGLVGDGLTTGTALMQIVNLGASGAAVRAVPGEGFIFARWSDGSLANPRADANVVDDLAFDALFFPTPNGAAVWRGYR